jgi:hypothetical protein
MRVCPKLWDFFATRNLEELQAWERHLPPAAQHSFPVSLDPTGSPALGTMIRGSQE